MAESLRNSGGSASGHGSGGLDIKNVLVAGPAGDDKAPRHPGFSLFLNEGYMNHDDAEHSCCFGACYTQRCLMNKVPCGRFKNKVHAIFCTFFSIMVTCMFISVIAPLVLYKLADDGIDEAVVIDSRDAESFKPWQRNTRDGDTKIHYDLYYFHITNPNEILTGSKPVVTEMGPYAYSEYYVKFDISWHDDGDKVSYNTWKYYLFDASRTGAGLSEDDMLTLPYPSVIGFQYLLGEIPEMYKDLLEAGVVAKIAAEEAVVVDELDAFYAAIEAQTLPPATKNALLTELRFVNISIHTYFDVSNNNCRRTNLLL